MKKNNTFYKILGAVLSSLLFLIIFTISLIFIFYTQFVEKDEMPWLIF